MIRRWFASLVELILARVTIDELEKGEAPPDAPTLADVLLGDTSEGDVLDESEFAYNGGNDGGDESDDEFEYDEDDDDI